MMITRFVKRPFSFTAAGGEQLRARLSLRPLFLLEGYCCVLVMVRKSEYGASVMFNHPVISADGHIDIP